MKNLFLFILLIVATNAFSQPVNPASVNISELSDIQVTRLLREAEARGLTTEQALTLARSQGATSMQIDQLRVRIQQLQMAKGASVSNGNAATVQASAAQREGFSSKVKISVAPGSKKIFGFALFNKENLTFEPSVNLPTPKHYVLGAGDRVMISVWGASQANYQLTIDQNGALHIPDIGPIYLSGSDFETARKRIIRRLYSIYSGLKGDQPNTWADVSLGGLRSIKVNVIGEVNAPGTYTLPATATAFNALYLSGGPNNNGSFRAIRVIRDGKPVETIDVYDFLVNANPNGNCTLRDGDILYIPTYTTRVEVHGAFKRNGLFELNEGETISDLLKITGGMKSGAYTRSLSLVRNTNRERQVKDIAATEFSTFTLHDGDQLTAGILLNRFENRVAINGAVFRPGTYALDPGMTLADLIKKAEGLKEEAFLERGLITRRRFDNTLETVAFNVQDVLTGATNLPLSREDQITIQSIFALQSRQTITISGEVQHPGRYPFSEKLTLQDIIFKAGGFNEEADIAFVEVARRLSHLEAANVTDQLAHIRQFAVNRNLTLDNEAAGFALHPFDAISVRRAPGFRDQGSVRITGEVIYAGEYNLATKNERLTDLIQRAGGLTPEAWPQGAILTRRVKLTDDERKARRELARRDSTITLNDFNDTKEIVGIDLPAILANPGSEQNLLLQPGDHLHLPEEMQTVKVSGNVLNPVALAFRKGMPLTRYVQQAGGFAPRSRKGKIYVLYPNGTTAATRSVMGIRHYPPIAPGCEIIIPVRPEKERDQTKWLTIGTSLTTLAVSVATIVNLSK